MTRSDLRTGMLVTLRNGEQFYVMLDTGLFDMLVNRNGFHPLRKYAGNLTHHDDPDDIFPNTPEEDRQLDIMQVSTVLSASYMCDRKYYKTIWEREE